MNITVGDIVRSLGSACEIIGTETEARTVERVSSLGSGSSASLSFCNARTEAALELVRVSNAGVVIVWSGLRAAFEARQFADKVLIMVPNPRLAFAEVAQRFFASRGQLGIHPSAVIAPGARIGENVSIGAYTVVGERCEIGDGTIIHDRVSLYPHTRIGKRVIVHSNTVIGADGFGYERNEHGELEKFPHLGGVVIGDDVEIGSNTSIDRGALDDTVIGEGTKIDNLVHIAHNVVIGKHCTVIAHAMLGGSVTVGDGSWISPSACIRQKIKIGKDALVGMGAVVVKDVPDGVTVVGNPARPFAKS